MWAIALNGEKMYNKLEMSPCGAAMGNRTRLVGNGVSWEVDEHAVLAGQVVCLVLPISCLAM